MGARELLASLAPLAAAWAPLTGCYSWQVGAVAASSDGGDGGSTLERDADAQLDARPLDAPAHDSATTDARRPTDASTCAELLAAVRSDHASADVCVFGASPPQCTTAVTDECGCQTFVAAENAAAEQYQAAIAALLGAGCDAGCSGCVAATESLCLETVRDGGAVPVLACTVTP